MEVLIHWQIGKASGDRLCVTCSQIRLVVSDIISNSIGWQPFLRSDCTRTYNMATALLGYKDKGCTRAYKSLFKKKKKSKTALPIILHHI